MMEHEGNEDSGTGYILRLMREEARLRPDQLAQLIGVSLGHIYKLERGQNEPSLKLVKNWVVVTRPRFKLMWMLLVPREYARFYRMNRNRGPKDGNQQ